MAAPKKPKTAAKPRRTQQKHYRNLQNVPISFRLNESDRKVTLAARGQRGDVDVIKKGEMQDPIFLANRDLIFEVITAEEAKVVIEKQSTNISEHRSHPAWDTIRTPTGEEYNQSEVRLEDQALSTGAPLDVEVQDGNIVLERQGQKGVQIKRAALPGSEDRPLPHIPDSVAPEDQAQYLSDLRANTTKTETERG